MKKLPLFVLTGVLGGGLVFTGAALAERGGYRDCDAPQQGKPTVQLRQEARQEARQEGRQEGDRYTKRYHAQLRAQLDLDAQQDNAVDELLQQQRQQHRQARQSLHQLHQSLRQLDPKKADYQEQLDTLRQQAAELARQRIDDKAQFQANMRDLLTDAQWQQWQQHEPRGKMHKR